MPCESGPSIPSTREELDRVTRLLCEACRVIEKAKVEQTMSSTLGFWWSAHKEQDRARLIREKEIAKRDKAARKRKYEELRKEFE